MARMGGGKWVTHPPGPVELVSHGAHITTEPYAEYKERQRRARAWKRPYLPIARPAWFNEPDLRDKITAGR